MGANANTYQSYSEVKERLDAISEQVADETLPLDDALDLYEEAVKLAMRASELIEVDEPATDAGDAEAASTPQEDGLAGQEATSTQG